MVPRLEVGLVCVRAVAGRGFFFGMGRWRLWERREREGKTKLIPKSIGSQIS